MSSESLQSPAMTNTDDMDGTRSFRSEATTSKVKLKERMEVCKY